MRRCLQVQLCNFMMRWTFLRLTIMPRLAFGEAGMDHAHPIGGVSFNDCTDGVDAERIALRLKVASTRLVIGGGTCHSH